MAKSIKSVYFDSELVLEAEKKGINLNVLCNEALRSVLCREQNNGSVRGAVGQELSMQMEEAEIKKKLNKRLNRLRADSVLPNKKYYRDLKDFCDDYKLSVEQARKLIAQNPSEDE